METEKAVLTGRGDEEHFERAVRLLLEGELVAFPTETVYGLGALATSEEAVRKIYKAKGRPSDNPLIAHVGTAEEVMKYAADVPNSAKVLMDAFWPGPLTLILKAAPGVFAPSVTAGLDTVGLRMPDHPVALRLLRQLGRPVAAPSANTSGKPSPTSAYHVAADLAGKISYILDGGRTGIGIESTVLDLTSEVPAILRPGAVTAGMLEPLIGPVNGSAEAAEAGVAAPRAPGMKYTHYSPEAPVFIIRPDVGEIREAVDGLHREGRRVALVAPAGFKEAGADWFFPAGKAGDPESVSADLYAALRECDTTDADLILAAAVEDHGIGRAVMNRLNKSAGGKWFGK
ncbi:L-threonylcarbamoyladenylate synthase [Bhargavaea ullalensis]